MTEQEAGAWAFGERLKRIWTSGFEDGDEVFCNSDLELFLFAAKVRCDAHEVNFLCRKNPYQDPLTSYQFFLTRTTGKRCSGQLICFAEDGEVRALTASPQELDLQESFAQFAQQWLPFFRRGCWLSGCDIEASAHEKAEWIQGFTREEIEQWNLKI